MLGTHVPYTADRIVTVTSTGDSNHELTGFPANEDVQILPLSILGRTLFPVT